jgi:predicted unusual protein kinase regulating ubiquinone biosynthesis (AarF/ABC1/UbiB family)
VQVRGTIEKELGKPMSDVFADFVVDPLATASVSTVVSKLKSELLLLNINS